MAKKRAKTKPKPRSSNRSKGRSKLLPVLLVISLAVNALLGYAYFKGEFSTRLLQPKAAQKYHFLKNDKINIDKSIGGIDKLPALYQLAASNVSGQLPELLQKASITSDSPFFVEKVALIDGKVLLVTATEGHYNRHLYLTAVIEGEQIKATLLQAEK